MGKLKFIQAYLPFVPLIEEFANYVKRGADIEAGNSSRGLFTALGELLNSFKELIKDGYSGFHALCGGRPQKAKFPLCLKITGMKVIITD